MRSADVWKAPQTARPRAKIPSCRESKVIIKRVSYQVMMHSWREEASGLHTRRAFVGLASVKQTACRKKATAQTMRLSISFGPS